MEDSKIAHTNELMVNLAFEIVKAAKIRTILYVDTGNLPKTAALKHIEEIAKKAGENVTVIPRQHAPNEIVVLPGAVTADEVLEVAKKLSAFCLS